MCVSLGGSKAPPPPPPPPEVEAPTAAELKASTPQIKKKSASKTRGKRSLRTDVGYGGGASGLNIP